MGRIAFSREQKESILRQAQNFWDRAERNSDEYAEFVNEMERMARGLLPKELEDAYAQFPDRSCLVPPDIYNNLNSLRANMRLALFRKKPYFSLSLAGKPHMRSPAVEKAEIVLQTILDLENEGKGFPSLAEKPIYQALYCGLGCTFLRWTRNVAQMPVRNPETQELIVDKDGKVVMQEQVVSEYPETVPLDIRRVRLDPSASEFKDMRIVGYQSLNQYSTLAALNKDDKSHYQFDEKELWRSTFDRGKYFEKVNEEKDRYGNMAQEQSLFGDKPIEVWSIRGLFRFEKPGGSVEFKDLIVEIGNRKVLLALKENDLPIPGYRLFDFPACDEQYSKMYTMGVIEAARDAFIEQFIKLNQSLDSANRNTYTTFIGDAAGCEGLPRFIETSNDQLLKVDLMAAGVDDVGKVIRPLERPQLGQDTFTQAGALRNVVQQTMRLSDYLQGVDPGRSETATGVAELVTGGRLLTDHLIEKIGDTFLRSHAIKKLILWNYFMADRPSSVYTQYGKVMTIAPGEINLPWHASIETSVAATSPSMIRRFVEAYPMISQDPYFDPMVVRQTLNEMLDLPNRERLIPPEDFIKMTIDRENMALGEGVPLPVHPLDNHQSHMEYHLRYIEETGFEPNEEMAAHIEEHQTYIAQQAQALGNTKEGGGLSASGNLVQPQGRRMKPQARGATGAYMPSEARK